MKERVLFFRELPVVPALRVHDDPAAARYLSRTPTVKPSLGGWIDARCVNGPCINETLLLSIKVTRSLSDFT